jgi:hypothetical protein
MSDLQKMMYLLNESIDILEPNLIDKMMYLLNEPMDQLPNAEIVDDHRPTPIVDGQPIETVDVQSPGEQPVISEESTVEPTYNTNCDDPANQDIVADFITIDGKNNVTKKCITGNDFK